MQLRIPTELLNPGQVEFLKARDWATLLAGGYGGGKTTGVALKTLHQVGLNPGIPGLLISPTRGSLKAVTYEALRRILNRTLPPQLRPKWVDPQEESYLLFPGGTRVYLRSSRNVESFEGLDVGWVGGDEVRLWTKRAMDVALGRARVRCPYPSRFFASTPSMGHLDDEFNSVKPGRRLIIAPTRENIRNLQPDYIDNLRLSYSKRLQAAVIDGEFTILEGAVFEAFIPRKGGPSIIDTDGNPGSRTYLAIDPGFRRSSVIWIRQLTSMSWVVFHQMQIDSMAMSMVVNRVNEYNRNNRVSIDEVWCDPAADNREQADAQTVMDQLARIEFRGGWKINRLAGRYRSIPWGVEKVRVLLGDEDVGQKVRLFFSSKLFEGERGQPRGVIKSLASLSYPEVKEGKPISDHPVKDGLYEHAVDALRYWVVGMWLSVPELRRLDSDIGTGKQGYRTN